MLGPYVRQQIENWVSDFCGSDRMAAVPTPLREIAPPLLTEFLVAACQSRDIEPADLEEHDVKAGIIAVATRVQIPPASRSAGPGLVGDFLESLESEGRLGGGRLLGAYARALGSSFMQESAGKPKPFTNPGSKLSRNDPSPCGSGQKYKKCCIKAG